MGGLEKEAAEEFRKIEQIKSPFSKKMELIKITAIDEAMLVKRDAL